MVRNGLRAGIAALLIACSFSGSSAYAADGPSRAEAKKAAKAAVTADPSHGQIDSPFKLKVRGCSRSGARVNCTLFRSVSQACKLNGKPSPDTVCAMVVAHRAWTVRVTKHGGNVVATITSQADVSGTFEPEPIADTARRRR